MSLHVEVVESPEALAAIAPAWQALDDRTFPRLPFTGPRWNLLWWKHFARSRRTVTDRIHSFVMFDENELLAVAPMMLTERPAVGALRTRNLQFFGTDPNVTEIRGLCCRRDDEGRIVEALLAYLEGCHRKWDWLELSGLVDNGAAFATVTQRNLVRRDSVRWTRPIPDFFIQPGNDWETFKTTLPRNIKESLRKCYSSLRRDNLHYELRVAERPSDIDDRLPAFLRLHSLRAQAPTTPPHPDVFQSRAAQDFLREHLALAAEARSAKLFELLVEGRVVASRIGFVLGDNLYLYFSGYDPQMSKYSVMTTCTTEAIKWAISNGLTTINLSPGRDQSKMRWRPTELPLIDAHWDSPSWRGPALHGFELAMRKRVTKATMLPGPLGSFVRHVHQRWADQDRRRESH